MKLRTDYDPKPIPLRQFDWIAVDDSTYEGGAPIGYGRTEHDAIADPFGQMYEREEFPDFG